MAEHGQESLLDGLSFCRESAGAAEAVPANHPTPETLYRQLVVAIRVNTHPVEPGTRKFKHGTRRSREAKEGCDGAMSLSVAELLGGYVGDISPLLKAKAVASALPPEPVLP